MGVTTMKMISKTRTTSTSGVTLISDLTSKSPLADPACMSSSALFDEVVKQLVGRVVHFDVETFNAVLEVVVHPHRRDGHEKTERRRNQCFCNTGRYCAESAATADCHRFECVND